MTAEKLHVDVWSDIACPWCYIGKRRLEAALARFAHATHVEVQWRAFELAPSAPKEEKPEPYPARIARKYGQSPALAEAAIQRMVDVARRAGLDFHFERIRRGNMFDAHRVLHLAHERGRQDAVKERFLLAYMTEGALMSDADTLVRLASEVGLDGDEVRATLASDAHAASVRADEREAKERGIRIVPSFVVAGKHIVSGVHPLETLLRTLTLAWGERDAKPESFAEGAACEPDGCA